MNSPARRSWYRLRCTCGFSLIEVLIVMGVMGIISAFIFPSFWQFQDQGVREISKNDLYDRGQRLGIYLERELAMAGFLLGRRPDPAIDIVGLDDANPSQVVSYNATIVANDPNNQITILRAESFFPKLTCTSSISADPPAYAVTSSVPDELFTGLSGNDDRRARLGVEADTAYNYIAFENHKRAYPLTDPDNGLTIATASSGSHAVTFNLADKLREDLSAGSEILRVRARRFRVVSADGESQLRMEDGKISHILDRAVDGLRLSYQLEDGTWQDLPERAEEIRAIRLFLLVRDLKPQKGLVNHTDYSAQMDDMASGTYGPYDDAYRRLVVVKDVEVKNYAAR